MYILSFLDEVFQLGFFIELQTLRWASINAPGHSPAIIQEMGATGAFLGDVQAFIEVDGMVRTGIHTVPAASTPVGVDYYQSVVSFKNRLFSRAGSHTRCF